MASPYAIGICVCGGNEFSISGGKPYTAGLVAPSSRAVQAGRRTPLRLRRRSQLVCLRRGHGPITSQAMELAVGQSGQRESPGPGGRQPGTGHNSEDYDH